MIVACPGCSARYQIEPDRLRPEGVRLRCTRCEAVFRVSPPPTTAQTAGGVPSASPPPVPMPEPEAPSEPAPSLAPPMSRPASPVPASPPVDRERVVLIADPEIEQGKSTASALAQWGFQPTLVHDGVEAILAIQRLLPRAIVIDAALPKMFGFQICEIVKRNESLRDIHVVLVGAIHNRARYRRPPEEIYGADAYIERQELPESLRPILQEFGMLSSALQPAPASVTAAAPLAPPVDVPTPSVAPTPSIEPTVSVAPVPSVEPAPPVAPAPPMEPTASVAPVPSVESASPIAPTPPMEPAASDSPASPIAPAPSMEPTPSVAPAVAPLPVAGVPVAPKITEPAVSTETSVTPRAPEEVAPTAPASGDPGIDEKIEQAERLARIVVSDIVLYSKDKFEAAVEAGNVLEAMQPEIAEGRSLFTARIDPAIQKTRDFLTEELLRVAETRSKP